MIHDRLSVLRVPPFRCKIILAARDDDPEIVQEARLLDLGQPGFF
jgi:hypothetical protein